jgi:HAMP domain-containing protein
MRILPTIVAAGLLFGYALAWAHDLLARKAFEATLTDAEREQFDAYRRVLPWRNFADVVELDRMTIKSALDGISSLSQQLQTLRQKLRASRAA